MAAPVNMATPDQAAGEVKRKKEHGLPPGGPRLHACPCCGRLTSGATRKRSVASAVGKRPGHKDAVSTLCGHCWKRVAL